MSSLAGLPVVPLGALALFPRPHPQMAEAKLVAELEGLVPGTRVHESGASGRWQPQRNLSCILGNSVSSRFLHKYASWGSSGLGLGLRSGAMLVNLEFLRSLKYTGGETPLLGAVDLKSIHSPVPSLTPQYLSAFPVCPALCRPQTGQRL